MKLDRKILVLGVGNLLLRDEGVGIHAVRELNDRYHFSGNVELVDGGTMGSRLIGILEDCDRLIVVDAVRQGGLPGSLYRLGGDQLPLNSPAKQSLHEVNFLETLLQCRLLGFDFKTVIIGMEPEDISPWSDELTPTVKRKMPDLIEAVLAEVTGAGGRFKPI